VVSVASLMVWKLRTQVSVACSVGLACRWIAVSVHQPLLSGVPWVRKCCVSTAVQSDYESTGRLEPGS
jgi:hypothetical protein